MADQFTHAETGDAKADAGKPKGRGAGGNIAVGLVCLAVGIWAAVSGQYGVTLPAIFGGILVLGGLAQLAKRKKSAKARQFAARVNDAARREGGS